MTMFTLDTKHQIHTLPEGYTTRSATMEDIEKVVAMFNRCAGKLVGVDNKFTLNQYQNVWQTPGFNLETDTLLVIAPDGSIVGYYELFDITEPHVTLRPWGRVHPEHEGKGIGTYMLNWAEKRARQAMLKAPEGARVTLQCGVISVNKAGAQLMEEYGMKMIRHSLRMVIDLNDRLPSPQFPAGISIRTMSRPQDDRVVVEAVRDSFKDHWGYVETPFEEDLAYWQHIMDTDEEFDPSIWFLAMDADQIAGVSLCWNKVGDDPDMGWLGTLGVRRQWRKQGLGLALLYHTFAEFYRRGKPRVGLGVDAESLTGATRLYERAGMHSDPNRMYSIYEMELRAGDDLSTQSVNE
jgi:mycothiol synthase